MFRPAAPGIEEAKGNFSHGSKRYISGKTGYIGYNVDNQGFKQLHSW